MKDLQWWAGLIAAVCASVAGQAEIIPEPYRHYVSLIGIVATVVCGYKITPTQPEPPKS